MALAHGAGGHPREQLASAAILEHNHVAGALAPDEVRLHHEVGAAAAGALVGSPSPVQVAH